MMRCCLGEALPRYPITNRQMSALYLNDDAIVVVLIAIHSTLAQPTSAGCSIRTWLQLLGSQTIDDAKSGAESYYLSIPF